MNSFDYSRPYHIQRQRKAFSNEYKIIWKTAIMQRRMKNERRNECSLIKYSSSILIHLIQFVQNLLPYEDFFFSWYPHSCIQWAAITTTLRNRKDYLSNSNCFESILLGIVVVSISACESRRWKLWEHCRCRCSAMKTTVE